jgi:hypothetical protein
MQFRNTLVCVLMTLGGFTLVTPGISSTGTSYLPPGWDEFCAVQNTFNFTSQFTSFANVLDIKCDILPEHSRRWGLVFLRQWTIHWNSTMPMLAYDVRCARGVEILTQELSLLRVRNLISLTVTNCVLTDILSGYTTLENYRDVPDQLIVLDIRHSSIVFDIDTFVYAIRGMLIVWSDPLLQLLVSRHIDQVCGPTQTLENITFHNLTMTPEITDDILTLKMQGFKR